MARQAGQAKVATPTHLALSTAAHQGASTNNRCGLRVPPLPSSSYITGDTAEKLLRMDNVGIVVESLDDAISFFIELGLTLEGRAMVEGEWAGRVTGLGNQRVEIAMMITPDGNSRIELSRFLTPSVVADHRNAPVTPSATCVLCSQ